MTCCSKNPDRSRNDQERRCGPIDTVLIRWSCAAPSGTSEFESKTITTRIACRSQLEQDIARSLQLRPANRHGMRPARSIDASSVEKIYGRLFRWSYVPEVRIGNRRFFDLFTSLLCYGRRPVRGGPGCLRQTSVGMTTLD